MLRIKRMHVVHALHAGTDESRHHARGWTCMCMHACDAGQTASRRTGALRSGSTRLRGSSSRRRCPLPLRSAWQTPRCRTGATTSRATSLTYVFLSLSPTKQKPCLRKVSLTKKGLQHAATNGRVYLSLHHSWLPSLLVGTSFADIFLPPLLQACLALADLAAARLKRYMVLPEPDPEEEEELLVSIARRQPLA